MTTFRIREPVDILKDYQDKAERELFRQEQFINRYADDHQRVQHINIRLNIVKQIRANLRKTRRAITRLEAHPETTPTPEVRPHRQLRSHQ